MSILPILPVCLDLGTALLSENADNNTYLVGLLG